MNLNKIVVVLVVLIAGIFIATAGSFAAKPDRCSPWPACKDDGGDPPPPPPPAECNNPSPSFVYVKPGGRSSADVTYISSVDGCNHIPLPGVVGSTVHMTDVLSDGSVDGVLVWKEDPSGQNIYQIRRADFTVDSAGALTRLDIDPDPLPLEVNSIPEGDILTYHFPDVWGSSTHGELYLVFGRFQGNVSGNGSHSLWIYNLDDPTDNRELYLAAQADGYWNCPAGAANPEAIAGCYVAETPMWSPDGTALYFQDTLYSPDLTPGPDSVRWNGTMRLQISRGGLIRAWGISPPEIVFTGSSIETVGEPWGLSARLKPAPGGDLILVEGDENHRGMLDVDLCIVEFTPPISDPDPVIDPDKWLGCLIGNDPYSGDPFVLGAAPWSASWLSANDKLHSIREKRNKVSVYRTNIHDGVSTKLIDDAEGPDTGN